MFIFRQLDNDHENDRQEDNRKEKNLLRTHKISQTKQILFPEHKSQIIKTNLRQSS